LVQHATPLVQLRLHQLQAATAARPSLCVHDSLCMLPGSARPRRPCRLAR
jgi:hypothetical protein